MAERISVKAAAIILGMNQLSVQGGLRENRLPIGAAWKNEGKTTWMYHISPYLLGKYIGENKQEVLRRAEEIEKGKQL